jgi:hypothetical protein
LRRRNLVEPRGYFVEHPEEIGTLGEDVSIGESAGELVGHKLYSEHIVLNL